MARNQKDFYYQQAQKEGYRSRASYKLKQINDRAQIIKRGDTIVDLGAAPGGWLQVAKELSGGRILGVDLQGIKEIEGVSTIKGDITAKETIDKILDFAGKGGVDVVLCDAAPNLSGNWVLDHARGIALNQAAFECAKKILKPKGIFVVKVFQGDLFKDFFDAVGNEFVYVKAYSPQASRSTSAEIYVIAKRFLTAPVRKNDVCAVTITETGESGDGIAYLENFVIFVRGAQVGDIVKVKIEDVKPNFAFADVLEKLEVLPENPYVKRSTLKKPDLPVIESNEKPRVQRTRDRSLDIDNYIPPKENHKEDDGNDEFDEFD
ncbi:Ribosomal RNA large subunit methyltransferase E [Methanolapillus ohkumae]|uniref:Ribosomal RNA large subunit methyltransferase E n=1 Tax=Methanolapillus ohkumae TaxID=3028298 RepID=A0AA96V7B8_9EURY|nr:Ribosomal RNA large subunit methyltransferase E [Methanosarcinaceae archaeon Am2]